LEGNDVSLHGWAEIHASLLHQCTHSARGKARNQVVQQVLLPRLPEERSSQSSQAKRGSAQDFGQFGDREVRTDAHEPKKTDIPDFSDANEPYVDGGGIYAPRRRRLR
jgi:hypothetical protein